MVLVTATGSAIGFGLATSFCTVWQGRHAAVTGLMIGTLLGGLGAYCAAVLAYRHTHLTDTAVMQLFALSFLSAIAGAIPGIAHGIVLGRKLRNRS